MQGAAAGCEYMCHLSTLRTTSAKTTCACGLQLKEKALQSVNMSKLIDIELHKQWFCGEVCSTSRQTHNIQLQPRGPRVFQEFVFPPRCLCTSSDIVYVPPRRRTRKRQGRERDDGVKPAFVSFKNHQEGKCVNNTNNSRQMDGHTSQDKGVEPPVSDSVVLRPGADLVAHSDQLDLQQQDIDDTRPAEVYPPAAADDYDTQGFQLNDETSPDSQSDDSRKSEVIDGDDDYTQGSEEDDNTSVDEPTCQRIGESGKSEVEDGDVLESEAGSSPDLVDLSQDIESSDGTDDGDHERRTYSQRRRVKPEPFDPWLESIKPQLLPSEKKHATLEATEGPGGAGAAATSTATAVANSRGDLDVPSQSFSASGDSTDGSDRDPPEHIMLELFCGTCTVSQVRSILACT